MKTIWLRLTAQVFGIVILILSLATICPAATRQSNEIAPSDRIQAKGQVSEPSVEQVVQDLEQAIAKVQPFLNRYGYLAVFLAIMVEGIGILAPGQTLLIAAVLSAAQGDLNLVWVLFMAVTGAILGNSLGYMIGRFGGRPLLHKIKVNERRLQRLEGYFARHGKGVVLMARFFDGLRQLNGIVAGMLKMPWLVFTIFNVLGAILWTGVWGLGTYYLDKKIAASHLTSRQIELWVASFCILAFLAMLLHLLRHRQEKSG